MRALVVEQLLPDYAGCVVTEVPLPEPGPGQVRIRVRAAAVNFPDLMQTRGEHQHKPQVPFVGGLELAGEVDAIGLDVVGLGLGQAVVAGARGGFAEYAIVPATALCAKPERLSFAQAAGFQVAYLTAYVALVCVDLAKALGCRVIAASASAAKLEAIQADYAPDAVVDVSQGFREAVKAVTGGKGADVIYDPVGGDVFDESTRCIAFGGRILSIGFTSGRLPTLPVNIALIKGFSVHGVRAGEYGRQFPEKGAENLEAIWRMAEAGELKPRVHAEYPLARWREAFETLENRQVVGKTVIRPDL